MATLASLEKQIEALKKKADAIRTTEKSAAIKTARDLIQQYGLTAQDVGLDGSRGRSKAKTSSAPKVASVPKYRDPQTGKTWTGHGKPPGWIAGAADRTKFLIDAKASAALEAPTTGVTAPKAAKVTKAAPAKKAPTKNVAAKKAPAVKQAPRAVKAVKAAPKATQPAAKKAGAAKVQNKATEVAAKAESA